jgi:hypothetical protein
MVCPFWVNLTSVVVLELLSLLDIGMARQGRVAVSLSAHLRKVFPPLDLLTEVLENSELQSIPPEYISSYHGVRYSCMCSPDYL